MAKQQNIVFDQGTDVSIEVSVLDDIGVELDLSGYTAQSSIRKHYTSNSSLDFLCETSNSTITLSLSNIESGNITPGRYVYDVIIIGTSSNLVTRIVEGICTIRPRVTINP